METVVKEIKNNNVQIIGVAVSDFEYDHTIMGESFYKIMVEVSRLSNRVDMLPVVVSERLVDVNASVIGIPVTVKGQFRSYNKHESNANRLILYVFAREFECSEDNVIISDSGNNTISLEGYICKPPIYRKTPFGREITDILLAVNRTYGKCDYIPCICWGRNAIYVSGLEIGQRLEVCGRVQSREYSKKISESEFENRTAFEVSVNRLELVREEYANEEEM